jgi:hypothetical protein
MLLYRIHVDINYFTDILNCYSVCVSVCVVATRGISSIDESCDDLEGDGSNGEEEEA